MECSTTDDWIESLGPENPVPSVDGFVHEPIDFSEMLRDAETKEMEGVRMLVASVEHVIAMKRQAGRTRDFLDTSS